MKKLIYFISGGLCALGIVAYGVNAYHQGRESALKEVEGNSDKEKSE